MTWDRPLRALGVAALWAFVGLAYQPVRAPVAVAAEMPKLNLSDVGVYEGSSGLTPLLFLATLSEASAETVTVEYVTVDGSALAGEDYGFGRGHLTFLPGETGKYFTVWAKGDTTYEPDEAFGVSLYDPVNALIERGAVAGLILNDDLEVYGGRGLRLRPDIMELTWLPGTTQLGYFVTRVEIFSGKSEMLGPLAGNASKFRDVGAPLGTLVCYVLTPVTPQGPGALSDLVCGQGGVAVGVKAPLHISIGYNDMGLTQVKWETPNQGVDLYAVAFISLIDLPVEFGALPPEATELVVDTKGLPTCFIVFGAKGDLGGMSDPVCAIGGFSGATKAAQGAAPWSGLDAGQLQRGLQQAKDALPPQVGAALP